MAELQSKLNELRGQLSVLQEQYSQALFAAETNSTDTTRTALQSVENRINSVGAGVFKLSNATDQKLKQLEESAKNADAGTELLGGEISIARSAMQGADVAKADALADQMDREVRDTTVSFFYHLIAVGLVGMMAFKLRAPQ